MRLLDTSSLTLHEFFGDSIPPYAILSHRWEGAEVIFQDLEAGITSQKESSFAKISGYCRQAAVDGWKYAWVDSCCIDKTSSSELSEAINSMFQWYRGAEVCYVYLSDVPSGLDWLQHSQIGSRFRLSEWWTRGWTLQELLAPDDLIFYDCEWREIGTKRSSEFVISDITGISRIHLHGYTDASVAQKMSWAANRETTRPEDRAYSLLGLFNVNMPPLYGEGPKAFRRLQLEILRDSDDESLFAWQTDNGYRGELFAPSPAAFASSGKIVRSIFTRRPAYSMTNKGLQIELTLVRPVDKSSEVGVFWTPLNCGWEDYDGAVGLVLIEGDMRCETPTFKRNQCLVNIEHPPNQERTLIYLRQEGGKARQTRREQALRMSIQSLEKHGFNVCQQGIWRKWIPDEFRVLQPHPISGWQSPTSRLPVFLIGQAEFLYLKFSTRLPNHDGVSPQHLDKTRDSFVIVLSASDLTWTISVRLIILPEAQSLEAIIEQDNGRLEPHLMGQSDRTSKPMKSGRSVSAALRRGNENGSQFTLGVTIDPEGKLPWPET